MESAEALTCVRWEYQIDAGWAGVSPSENRIRNVQREEEEASMTLWCWVSRGDIRKNGV